MKLLISLITILSFTSLASGIAQIGSSVNYNVKVVNIDLMSWDIEVTNKLNEQTYSIQHNVTLPYLGDKQISHKMNKNLLNSKLKSQIILSTCSKIGGEKVKLKIKNGVSACKLPIQFAKPSLLKSLRKLKLYNPRKSKGYIYLGEAPILGVVKIETNIVQLEMVDFSWR